MHWDCGINNCVLAFMIVSENTTSTLPKFTFCEKSEPVKIALKYIPLCIYSYIFVPLFACLLVCLDTGLPTQPWCTPQCWDAGYTTMLSLSSFSFDLVRRHTGQILDGQTCRQVVDIQQNHCPKSQDWYKCFVVYFPIPLPPPTFSFPRQIHAGIIAT